MKYLILIIVLFSFSFCDKKNNEDNRPIAKVGDAVLLKSATKYLIKPGTSAKDSIAIIKAYCDKWISKQLLLQRAEMNLLDDEKDVEEELEEYRQSLMIYKYQQKMLREKLDTSISDAEMSEYYEHNVSNFLLTKDIVKAIYIKVPVNESEIESIKSWYRSDKDEDIKSIDSYCFHHAVEYNYFKDDWIYFERILTKLPLKIENKSIFLKNNKSIEICDSAYCYFVNIRDYKLRGDTTPLHIIQDNVKNIILKKRKMDFLNNLEEELYKDALQNNKFTIY